MAQRKKPDALERVVAGYTDHPDTVIVRPDLSDLTVGQEEEVEDLIGESIWGTLGNETKLQAKVKRAIAYVVRKAEDPTLTWEDSARLRLLMLVPGGVEQEEPGDTVPPTNGRGSSTRSRSANTSRSSTGKTSKP
jgi:hypothetical protein